MPTGRLGDIFADLRAIAQASQSYRDVGSIGPWIQDQLQQFRGLPSSVDALFGQARAVRQVFTGSGAVPALETLDRADGLLSQIRDRYAGINQRVSMLLGVLVPLMPKINAGNYDADVVGTLLSSGLDIVGTIHGVNDLIGKRDEAQQLIEQAITDPSVPPDIRQQAMAAFGQINVTEWVKYAVLGTIGYLVIKSVMRKSA